MAKIVALLVFVATLLVASAAPASAGERGNGHNGPPGAHGERNGEHNGERHGERHGERNGHDRPDAPPAPPARAKAEAEHHQRPAPAPEHHSTPVIAAAHAAPEPFTPPPAPAQTPATPPANPPRQEHVIEGESAAVLAPAVQVEAGTGEEPAEVLGTQFDRPPPAAPQRLAATGTTAASDDLLALGIGMVAIGTVLARRGGRGRPSRTSRTSRAA